MCFGFSNYVLLASYQTATKIGLTNMNEEEQTLVENSLTELNSFYLKESSHIVVPLIMSLNQSFAEINYELPSSHLSLYTPPPNLT